MHGQQDRDGAQRMLGLHAFESPVSSQQTWQTQQWLSALAKDLDQGGKVTLGRRET